MVRELHRSRHLRALHHLCPLSELRLQHRLCAPFELRLPLRSWGVNRPQVLGYVFIFRFRRFRLRLIFVIYSWVSQVLLHCRRSTEFVCPLL